MARLTAMQMAVLNQFKTANIVWPRGGEKHAAYALERMGLVRCERMRRTTMRLMVTLTPAGRQALQASQEGRDE